jgi:hypothetical protein
MTIPALILRKLDERGVERVSTCKTEWYALFSCSSQET